MLKAVANRAFDDRRADVTAQVQSDLRQDSLSQQNTQFTQANTALGNAGTSIAGAGSQYGNNVTALTGASNAYGSQGSSLNNAGMAATGAMGAYGNANDALSTAGNFNSQISGAYNTGMNTAQTGGSMAMNAGGILNGFDQGQMDADRAAFEGNRDYAMNTYSGYNSGILGRAPANNQPISGNAPASPLAGALGGAMMGFDFQNQYFGGGKPAPYQSLSGPMDYTNVRPQGRPY